MKNIIAIVNYSVEKHAMRFIKHRYNPIDHYHLDVKNYGINSFNNILDDLDINKVHMVLSNNPLTAFKLFSKYPNDVTLCTMDDDCNYHEINTPSVEKVIQMVCEFELPKSLISIDEEQYIDCSVEIIRTPEHDGWYELNEFVSAFENLEILVIGDLYKTIHTTEKGTKVAFWNRNHEHQIYGLNKELKNIKAIIIPVEDSVTVDSMLDYVYDSFNVSEEYYVYYYIIRDEKYYVTQATF